MKIFKITVENFRLLRNFSIDLEDELSLVVGKNNTGKTSILSVLDKFLNSSESNKFLFDDFNIEAKEKLKFWTENSDYYPEEDFLFGIKLKIFIKYGSKDDLSNISKVMMDLDPDSDVVVLGFEYTIDASDFQRLKTNYQEYKIKEEKKAKEKGYKARSLYDFLDKKHSDFFKIKKKSFEFDKTDKSANEKNYIEPSREEISDILNFKFISAKRDVTNKESNKTLSGQASKIYKRTESSEEHNETVENFKDKLSETDSDLSNIYETLFEKIIKKVKDFGGIKLNESDIKIISTLQHRELLEGNTTVVYNHSDNHHLPEYYNGLGYMNLINMIFEIEILVNEFKKRKDQKPSDINLLLIEEPEAHTHPQMQYVFIKNIKKLLREGIKREDGETRELQYIVSTHSSHIVADSDFGDIKYLKKENLSSVIAKNLKDLEREYDSETPQYQFLKQYLTVSRAEIFFADKAILVEGDTEIILVPTLMKKIDIEENTKFQLSKKDDPNPLLSQNISIIEAGAYSDIFEKFIEFLGIKTLIITDLDATKEITKKNGKKCKVKTRVSDGTSYSNTSIKLFFSAPSLNDLKNKKLREKIISKIDNNWSIKENGNLCVVYQTEEEGYVARSFEDAFISLNRAFIDSKKDSFRGLKNRSHFSDPSKDPYFLAEKCIKKKTHFALDILFHSDENLSNWKIPSYIKEGLLWLKD